MIYMLLGFRTHRIGLSADVEKAFHKIQLHKADRDFVRFLWLRDDKDAGSDFDIYRFKVIPYGASSSPFILNSVIKKHLQGFSTPVSVDIESHIYVDNLISGCETITEAFNYYTESRSIFAAASLSLQSWAFYDPSLNKQATLDGITDISPLTKTLATKRDLLRGISSIYDPLRFISPLSIPARILIQEIWKEKLDWDDHLPPPFSDRWILLASSLANASPKISRSYFETKNRVHSLHVFVDASQQAYGAVAYLLDGDHSSFVMSKARVAPLKGNGPQLTLPQPELMAAVIGTLLASSIINAFKKLAISLSVTMWSDSQIVLYWLSKSDRIKNRFISNRV
ncbi:uncharacterized protein LOC116928659 [Daphnia magna]|uniref:uncharacterized protein LOC116928659 n=1 Tax=Daphnia magna TaxID=35525 RepID=UPI0014033FE2|nr:uncharacterized protein LOC116928659 [Daphnia magna]